MRKLVSLLLMALISFTVWAQIQQVRIDNGGSNTIYYKKIGVVNSNSGALRIHGMIGAHTPSQGKSTVDITFNSRDNFVAQGQIDGRSPNSYIILISNGTGYFGPHYDVYLCYAAWAQVDFNVMATGSCSTYDGVASTTNPGASFWSSNDYTGDLSSTSFVGGLSVNGTIKATEIKVEAQTADFVFEDNYHLKDLSEVEVFIKANKHLPEIPSAAEMEATGVNLAEMNKLLLMKVEELTLYSIGLEKEVKRQKIEVEEVRSSESEVRKEMEEKVAGLELKVVELSDEKRAMRGEMVDLKKLLMELVHIPNR